MVIGNDPTTRIGIDPSIRNTLNILPAHPIRRTRPVRRTHRDRLARVKSDSRAGLVGALVGSPRI